MKIYVVFKETEGLNSKYIATFTSEKKAKAYVDYKNSDKDEFGVSYEHYWYCPDYTSNIDLRF